MCIAVGTPASLSCGSMTLGSMTEHQRGEGSRHHLRHPSRDRAGNASPLLSPTHTADIHDFDTRDLTIITAGGIGTTSPSPPLTTSLSPGTSITSSPQHFCLGGRQTDDEEQEYTTAVAEQRGTSGTGGSQRQSPYRLPNAGQSNYGSTQSHQFPHHIHITASQTPTTTRIITQHPTTLPRSNTSKSKSNASNYIRSDRKSNQALCQHDWQKSASCKNLRNDSRFEKGRDRSTCIDYVRDGRGFYESVYRQERLIESPITRYDDSRRACYSAAGSKTSSVDRGSDTVPDTRIYSSSYPGTTSSLSTESGGGDEPGGMMEAGSECILLTTGGMDSGSQEEILYSHDDLSHDSYELLEREGEEEGDDEQDDDDEGRAAVRRRIKSYSGTRSCSLESDGEILPMDEVDEMSRVGQDGDMAVFQMDEIETVGSETYVKQRGSESSLENVIVRLQSTNTDSSGRKGLDSKSDDTKTIGESRDIQTSLHVQSPQFNAHECKGFDGMYLATKTINDEGNMQCINHEYKSKSREEEYVSISHKHITVGNDEGLIDSRSNKQAQTHFLEYNGKCRPGLAIDIDSREEVLTSGGRKVSMTHTPVERAKSDPHTGSFRIKANSKRKRRVLTHQKSIDMTPAGSGESDDDRGGDESSRFVGTMAASHSEYSIPYTLHKRHAMNGTAPSQETVVPPQVEMLTDDYKAQKSDRKLVLEDKLDDHLIKGDREKASDDKQVVQQQSSDTSGCFKMAEKGGERSYGAQMVRITDASCDTTEISKVDIGTDDDKISEAAMKSDFISNSAQMADQTKSEILDKFSKEPGAVIPNVTLRPVTSSDDEHREKSSTVPRKSRVGPPAELPTGPLLPRKRDRSPILFARARLGLSEGSAFSQIRQVGSPASSRRAKSLDAPVVAVHRLPPADAFSSKDDTLDNDIGKSEPLKTLEVIAKRLPSTIEDENDSLESDTQVSLSRQLEWRPPKQTSEPSRKHSPLKIDNKVTVSIVLNSSQLDKHVLPPQSANLEFSSPETAGRDAVKSVPPATDKEKVISENMREVFLSNRKEPVQSKAVQIPPDDANTQHLPSQVDTDVTPHTEACVSEEHAMTEPEVPYKPASLKLLKVNEATTGKVKSEQTAGHLHKHSAIKCTVDKNEQPQEPMEKDKSVESHTQKTDNLKLPQVTGSEIDAEHEIISEGIARKDVSSPGTHFPATVVDTYQEIEHVFKEISSPENVSAVGCEIDRHFKERGRKIFHRDKDGSSGDYQTFDDIDLPPEFRDHPDVSAHPEAVIEESSNEKRLTTQGCEYGDLSFVSKHSFQLNMKGSTSLKLEETECALLVPVADQAFLPTAASGTKSEGHPHPKTETKGKGILDMEVETPFAKEKAEYVEISGIRSVSELVSIEEQNVFVLAESETPQTPAPESHFVSVIQPENKEGETETFQASGDGTEKNEVAETLLVSATLPDTPLSEVERDVLVISVAKAEHQMLPSKGWQFHEFDTGTVKVKAQMREIIKIESHSLEKEEAVATSDDEIPAIPLDEEGSSLERWVSVEDIHEELLAADHALKEALDLGREFQYIDEDEERKSPGTCSDYDNLSSSSPSSHILAQDTELPLEQEEEFVEIELDRSSSGQRKEDRSGTVEKVTGSKMHKEVRVSSEDKATIATQESDSTVSSSAGREHMAENVQRSVEVRQILQVVKDDKSPIHVEISSQSFVESSVQENDSKPTVEKVVDDEGRSTALPKSSSTGQNILREEEQIKLSQEKEESQEKLANLQEQKTRSLECTEQDQQSVRDKVGLAKQGEVLVSLQERELRRKSKIKLEAEERIVIDEKEDNSDTMKMEQKSLMGVDSPESLKEGRDEESPESMKDDKIIAERSKSEEEASSSSSLALPVRVELSSTWRPFLLESSGSSSLEEGFFPPDEEETTSSPSNNEREEAAASIDFPATFGYPCIGDVITSVGGYGGPGVFALSRTLSRISERSTTSEQERSDLDDDSTKPSSRSLSVDDESLLSSDHQPSLSSDPPSGGPTVDEDVHVLKPPDGSTESDTPAAGPSPGNVYIPPPLLSDDDWPSPPTSSSLFETPVVSHVETFYMEIHPEEACKVLVIDSATDPAGGDGSSTDENHTLQDGDDDFLSGEGLSSSATTLDGTVKVAVRPKCPSHYCAGSSLSEDTSMGLSLSEWSSSTSTVRPQCPLHYSGAKSDNTSLDDLGKSVPDLPTSSKISPNMTRSPSYYSGAKSDTCLDDSSPTRLGKPTSGPKSRITFYSASKSLTSVDTSSVDVPVPIMSSERPVKVVRPKCTPYYSTAQSDEGDRMLESSVSRQGVAEKEPSSQSLEAPAGWLNERSMSTHSVQHVTGPKVRSKSYSYYSTVATARSPQSDGDTSSSLDGSNVTERVARAPKRRKSQPKKRHRVTVDLEVRDGQIVEVSSASAVETQSLSDQSQVSTQGAADSTSAVLFVPKQSSV